MSIVFIYGADKNAQTLQSSVSLDTIKQSLERICGLDTKCSDKVAVILEHIKTQLEEHPEYISIDKKRSYEAYMQAMDTLQNKHELVATDEELQGLVSAISVLDQRNQLNSNNEESRAPRPAVSIPGAPIATTPKIVDMPKDITVERDLLVGGNETITGTLTDLAMYSQPYGNGELRSLFIDDTGLIGAVASSSRRYKKNIEPINHGSEKILNLQPVSFVYKNDPAEKKQYGLIAEEAYEVYPEMVSLNSEGKPESVCIPRELTYMMLNEIQKNHKTIAALEAELATIKTILTKHNLL